MTGEMRTLLLIGVFVFNQATAQVALVNDTLDEHIFTLNDLTYFIDAHDTLTIETISAPAFAQNFWRHSSYQNRDFQAGAAYWIRMAVKYNSASKKKWIFEFYDQTIDHLEAFITPQQGD